MIKFFPHQILLVISFTICFAGCKKEKEELAETDKFENYQNPLAVEFGDPYILNDGSGTYYMYGTGGGVENGFAVYSSKNLIDWKFEGPVYNAQEQGSWGIASFWAPEVYKFDSKYYMFFSAQWKHNPHKELENFKIGVAVSDKPTGPFKDLQNEPLFDPGYPVIDANVFQDIDGSLYLYYSRVCYKHSVETEISEWARKQGWFDEIEESWVYGVRLAPDFKSIIGEPVLLLRPPTSMNDRNAEWESRSVTSKEVNRRWTEGSYTFRHGDTYYMMYSANYFGGENYAVGYATASSPLGPYSKAKNNPLLEKNTHTGGEVTGTGHNSLVYIEGSTDIYTVYHGRTKKTGDQRVVFIDKLNILENGALETAGPTTTEQPNPLSRNKDRLKTF